MIYEGMSNYYDTDKIVRTTGNGTRQEWFGVKEKEKHLVCAGCDGTRKAKKVMDHPRSDYTELVWCCGCGGHIVSITYRGEASR